MNDVQLETKKLQEVLEIVNNVLEEEKQELNDLYSKFVGDINDLWRIAEMKKIHIANLEYSKERPYFARIDFTYGKEGRTETFYIGKNGVMQGTDIVITDWRAPISSLYYDAEVGECSFEAPEGLIQGIMNLKRQYEIENGELIKYYDVDLVSTDSLLQTYLNSNNDARLKSIVSTIQKEQNNVIRKKMSDNLIVQGVAGSGKTTVALHRIAYLVYNYMKSIKQNQYLVIGPNPVFIKYIKSVLPELDVSSVQQCTFEDFAKSYINEEITINASDKKVNASISGKLSHDIDKFKCSMKYKQMIQQFLDVYFLSLTSNDLKLGDFCVLPKEQIRKIFEDTYSRYNSSLSNRVEMVINRLCSLIEENNDVISSAYNDYSYNLFKDCNQNDREKLRSKFAKEREEIKKNCRTTLRKYFSKSKSDVIKLYKLFINSIEDYNLFDYENIKLLKKQTQKNLKANNYDFEDLAGLIYIKQAISPDKHYEDIRHVVVDEAQDLGEFNFYVLKKSMPRSTFSIFGDLAQSIYDYRGINNWDEVNKSMFGNNGEIIEFTKSYRTTAEIMNVADSVAESIGLTSSDLVVRHGNPVSFSKVENSVDVPTYILEKILEYKEKGYKTIAIISKTNLLSCYINDDLADLGLHIPNVSINDDLSDEKFRICTISNQLAKGLEFDAVIINNADENIYSSNSNLDMKLLYVAITRALHDLDVVYTNELTLPLNDFIKKRK